jgi:hypothetical protein
MSATNPILGESGGRSVHVDVQRLITTRLLVQSNSGGGKSWAVRRLLEQTHGHVQQIVLDSEGEFFTLREKFDFVLAGRGGDCQAHPRSAATLARKLLELGVSAVIDLSELPHQDSMRHVDRVTFVANFCRGMLDAPRELWHPTLVILDEAHRFCPEGEPSASAAAVADLASAGRKRAFAVVLATQRISKLSKSAAAECNNRLVGRTGLDVDVRRAADELGFTTREERLSLRALQPGTFHVFGPAFAVTGVELVRIGKVETTHPEPGGKPPPVAPPRGKVVQLLSKLAAVPEEAEEETRSLEAALAEVRKAKGELAALRKSASVVDPEAIERAREEGRAEVRAAAAKSWRLMDEWFGRTEKKAGDLFGELQTRKQLLTDPPDWMRAAANGTHRPPAPANRVAPAPSAPRPRPNSSHSAHDLTLYMQSLLDAISRLEALGRQQVPRRHVAALAGKSPRSSEFDRSLAKLRGAGLIEYVGDGKLRLSEDGRGRAERFAAAPTAAELVDAYKRHVLSAYEAALLDVLIAEGGWISRDALSEKSGKSSRSSEFDRSLASMRQLELVEYGSDRSVRAAEGLLTGAAP